MTRISMPLAVCLLCACTASPPDHFYILTPHPARSGNAQSAAPTAQAMLRVTLPSLVDRPEIIINTSAERVAVLEHERWAAPLTDLMTQTLARDIEQRRPDVLVGGLNGGSNSVYKFTVDIVQVALRRGDRASIAAQWRMTGAPGAAEATGAGVFSAPLPEQGYTAIAGALSECLGGLADRLTELLPR